MQTHYRCPSAPVLPLWHKVHLVQVAYIMYKTYRKTEHNVLQFLQGTFIPLIEEN